MALTEKAMNSALRKMNHRHMCADRECRRVYWCIGIGRPACSFSQNGRCPLCSWGRASIYDRFLPPLRCCQTDTALIQSREQRTQWRLGSPGPWYLCRTCCRLNGWPPGSIPDHLFDPAETQPLGGTDE